MVGHNWSNMDIVHYQYQADWVKGKARTNGEFQVLRLSELQYKTLQVGRGSSMQSIEQSNISSCLPGWVSVACHLIVIVMMLISIHAFGINTLHKQYNSKPRLDRAKKITLYKAIYHCSYGKTWSTRLVAWISLMMIACWVVQDSVFEEMADATKCIAAILCGHQHLPARSISFLLWEELSHISKCIPGPLSRNINVCVLQTPMNEGESTGTVIIYPRSIALQAQFHSGRWHLYFTPPKKFKYGLDIPDKSPSLYISQAPSSCPSFINLTWPFSQHVFESCPFCRWSAWTFQLFLYEMQEGPQTCHLKSMDQGEETIRLGNFRVGYSYEA